MKLLFEQRLLSLFDSYDIYYGDGNIAFTVKGRFSIGRYQEVYDSNDILVGTLQRVVFSLLPRFEIYDHNQLLGTVKKEFSFFKPSINIDYKGWQVEGDLFEWEYRILDNSGELVATVSKELFKLTDTYVIDVVNESDALDVLMLTLAIDGEKDDRSN